MLRCIPAGVRTWKEVLFWDTAASRTAWPSHECRRFMPSAKPSRLAKRAGRAPRTGCAATHTPALHAGQGAARCEHLATVRMTCRCHTHGSKNT